MKALIAKMTDWLDFSPEMGLKGAWDIRLPNPTNHQSPTVDLHVMSYITR